jgi:hypothetical protein
MERRHTILERDTWFRSGKPVLKRTSQWSGRQVRNGDEIEIASDNPEGDPQDSGAFLPEFAVTLIGMFETGRLREITHRRRLSKRGGGYSNYRNHLIHLETTRGGRALSLLETSSRFEASLARLLARDAEWLGLPEHPSRDLDFHSIEFSSEGFGILLHEALGHRLESDDFSSAISFTGKGKPNFRVWDVPGSIDDVGFCPVDDLGTEGKPVLLLDARTGRQEFLTAESGNMRAIDASWHPIVRQRCLVVESLECPRPRNTGHRIARLIVDSLLSAELTDDQTHMEFTRCSFVDERGSWWRLPPLSVSVSVADILGFTVFGHSETHNPSGGCHKGLQRGLPISTSSPRAVASCEYLPSLVIEILRRNEE